MLKEKSGSDNLKDYVASHLKDLSMRLIDTVDEVFSPDSVRKQREFESDVQKRLKNGAKFIPRKREPR